MADLLATAPLLFPQVAKAMFGLSTAPDGSAYLYVSRVGASLMLGWTFLLVWASRKPVERKGVILLTVAPVLAGLAGASVLAVPSGFTPVIHLLPLWIFYALTIPLYVTAYWVASGVAKASMSPAAKVPTDAFDPEKVEHMRADDLKSLVARYVEGVWNQADPGALEDLISETFTYHLGGQPARDRAAMKHFLQAIRGAFPDWRVEIQDIVADGDIVVARWAGQATHRGVFHGISPTGRQISVCGINVYRVENGRIAEEWEQMDSLGMLQQLGVLPAAPQSGPRRAS